MTKRKLSIILLTMILSCNIMPVGAQSLSSLYPEFSFYSSLKEENSLKALIDKAKQLISTASIGLENGQYPLEEHNKLSQLVTDIEHYINTTTDMSTSIQNQLQIKLETAIIEFESSQINDYIQHLSKLNELISRAKTYLDETVVGTGVDNTSKESIDSLRKAFDDAISVANSNSTDSEVYIKAISKIQQALAIFEENKISDSVISKEKESLSAELAKISNLLKDSPGNSGNYDSKIALNVFYTQIEKKITASKTLEELAAIRKSIAAAIQDFTNGTLSVKDGIVHGKALDGSSSSAKKQTSTTNITQTTDFIPQAGLPFAPKPLLFVVGSILSTLGIVLYKRK